MQAVASNAALYLMSHEVDLQNPVCWLDKGPAGYSLPDVDQQVNPIRLCVQPCRLQFRSQAAHVKSDHETTDTKNSPVQYMHMKVWAESICVARLHCIAGCCFVPVRCVWRATRVRVQS